MKKPTKEELFIERRDFLANVFLFIIVVVVVMVVFE